MIQYSNHIPALVVVALLTLAYIIYADVQYKAAHAAKRASTDTPLAEHAIDACAREYVLCIRTLDYTSQAARSHVRAYLASTYGEEFNPDARRTIQRHAIVAARQRLARLGHNN